MFPLAITGFVCSRMQLRSGLDLCMFRAPGDHGAAFLGHSVIRRSMTLRNSTHVYTANGTDYSIQVFFLFTYGTEISPLRCCVWEGGSVLG